mmetsp:Transcript_2728/g.6052  ORF Transcript_2728/g.6052 Transcript_2728/m.6052 type:complete len:403 (+) Transcript_2728:118-1326(+)
MLGSPLSPRAAADVQGGRERRSSQSCSRCSIERVRHDRASRVNPIHSDLLATLEVAINRHGGHAAIGCGDHDLLKRRVTDVANRKHAGHARRHLIVDPHAAVVVQLHLVLEKVGDRLRARDVDENTLDCQGFRLLLPRVLELDAGDSGVVALDAGHARLAPVSHVWVCQQLLRGRIVFLGVGRRDPVHRLGKLGEELRLLHRLAVDAYNRHLALAVEGAVAGRAVAHALPKVRVLSLEGRLPPHGSRGENHRPRPDSRVGCVHHLLVAFRLHQEDLRAAVVGAVRDRLVLHLVEQRQPAHRAVDAGIVGDGRRDGKGPRGGVLVQHHRLQIRPGGVQRTRAAGGAAADNHHVAFNLLHHSDERRAAHGAAHGCPSHLQRRLAQGAARRDQPRQHEQRQPRPH